MQIADIDSERPSCSEFPFPATFNFSGKSIFVPTPAALEPVFPTTWMLLSWEPRGQMGHSIPGGGTHDFGSSRTALPTNSCERAPAADHGHDFDNAWNSRTGSSRAHRRQLEF
jgi:hypothetical protein